jgi:hypothetical protein
MTMIRRGSAAAVVFALVSGAAVAQERCSAPLADWQPRSALVQMAEGLGWTVSRIRTDDGCYVIRGRNKDGRDVRARIDPVSLKVLSTREGRGHRHDDDDEGDGRDETRRHGRGEGRHDRGEGRPGDGRQAAPADAPFANPLMKGRPQGQVQ